MPPIRTALRRRFIVAAAGSAVLAVLAAAIALLPDDAAAGQPAGPFVSELHYDNVGADAGEFVEVQVPAGTTIAGWRVVLYNGSGGVPYGSLPVPATTAPASGPAVVAIAATGLQNGPPDGLALVDDGGAVVEFLSYEGSFTASGGPAGGAVSGEIGGFEAGVDAVGQSLSRRYDPASDTWVWQPAAAATPGAVNPPLTPLPTDHCPGDPSHAIGAVQGSGFQTPLAGTPVTVHGVVVADLPGLAGIHVQDPGDGDPATSDGIVVSGPGIDAPDVDLGAAVEVTGTPSEVFGQTVLAPTQDIVVCAAATDPAGLPAPAPLDLPADDASREPLEGMLVAPSDVLTVSEVFALTRFGELTLSEGGLLVAPTELARHGPAAEAIAARNRSRGLVLDDGSSGGRSVTDRPYLTDTTRVRVGDELDFTAPLVLGFGFGSWRLQPADGSPEGTFALADTRPAAPDPVGGDVTVGAFNVLNYFLTLTGPDARGAGSQEELELQAAKIVTAIEGLDADVVSLMEVEDTASTGFGDGSPDQALADLVARLNAAAGFTKWSFAPFPPELLAVDRDVIRSAIIYQPAAVTPVGPAVGLVDETVWANAREPIAQTFARDGDTFTVVANHFKSKNPGTPPPPGDNADSGDGQGAFNGDRVRQAASLAAFTDQLRASTGDEDVMIVGDLNSYSQEDPVHRLRDAGFVDLGEAFDAGRYSYVFDGRSGSLDHALATAALTAKVTGVAHWNINSVESFAYQYTGDPLLYAPDQYRASDHDPLIVGIDLQ